MNKGTKLGIEVGLLAVIVFLGFLVYNSVDRDLKFDKELKRMKDLTKVKLMDAREIQIAFESKYGKYAKSWDDLITFTLNDSLATERIIGDMEDTAAVNAGLAYKETIKVRVLDRLVKDSLLSEGFDIEKLKYVPESDSVFNISATNIVSNGMSLPTFQIDVPLEVLMAGEDNQLILNAAESLEKTTGYPGVRVGNLEQASTEGNWE